MNLSISVHFDLSESFSANFYFWVNYFFKYYLHNNISPLGTFVSFFCDSFICICFFVCYFANYTRWIVSVCTAYLVCDKNDVACEMEVSGEHRYWSYMMVLCIGVSFQSVFTGVAVSDTMCFPLLSLVILTAWTIDFKSQRIRPS